MQKIFTAIALITALCLTGCKPSEKGKAKIAPPTQVIIQQARIQPIEENLSLVGTITANEYVEIKSETDGTVSRIQFEEGQEVKLGEPLLLLDDRKLAASLAEAEANAKLSESTFTRAKQLKEEKVVSQQEFDQASSQFAANQAGLEFKRQQLRETRILAPFSGMTGSRMVSPGQVIAKNTLLTTLVDYKTVKVEINIPERFLGQVKEKQQISLKVAAYPKETFTGEVYFVAPVVDRGTRTSQIKARVKNDDLRLKPGMFASLQLTLRVKEKALVISEAALTYSGDRVNVFVVGADQTAQVRPVQVGLRLYGVVEIAQGLGENESVIVEGVQKVRPGGKVVIAPSPQAPTNTIGPAAIASPASAPAPSAR